MQQHTEVHPAQTHAPSAMPKRPETKVVRLKPLKPRPAKATMKRVGIVPAAPHSPHVGGSSAKTADGIQFPANAGETDTNVVFHGGTTAGGVSVQLIYWGNSWNTSDATLQQQLTNAAMNLIDGPFYSALGQYGLNRPTFRGSITILSPDPPSSFDDGNVGDIVWACMDQNIFPEPDDPGGYVYYCVFMPPGTTYSPGGALGAHSYPTDYDFPFDIDHAWVAWVGHANLNTMTRVFGHETAETVTDPQQDGWYVDSTGEEIGDICNSRQSWNKGVFVEGFWAKNNNACVIAECPEVVSAVSRSTDHLDVFAIGSDSGTYTAAWQPGFSSWQGWWRVQGGIAAPGSSIFGVSRRQDYLDIFAVGTDLGVYTAAWQPGFTSWQGWWRLGNLTVAPGSNVHAVSRSLDHLDVFAVGSDFGIYTCGWSPSTGWSAWSRIQNGVAAAGTTVYGVVRNTDYMDVFAVGSDFGIYTAAWQPGFSSWQGWWRIQNGVAAPGTSVYPVSRSLNHLDVFAIGTDHGIYTAAWQPGFTSWGGWWRIQDGTAAPGTSVFACSRNVDYLDVFAVGTDHGIYTAAWQPGFPSWEGWWRIQNGTTTWGM